MSYNLYKYLLEEDTSSLLQLEGIVEILEQVKGCILVLWGGLGFSHIHVYLLVNLTRIDSILLSK